jgi:Zn-dependent M28 family amino/carboxypeptidase
MTDQAAHCLYYPGAANVPACASLGRGRWFRGGARGAQPSDRLNARQVSQEVDAFLVANKALLRINDAGRPHGQIVAYNNTTYDPAQTVPTVVMSNEDFGRITRILNDGTDVVLEFNIVNRVYPEGATSYNTIGEIRGTDKADEVIMLGGHLDSWHAATGATDNAIGCAIMMEAARILMATGAKPRRTIRVALWSGEEEGLLGSFAYVKEHFGSAEAPTKDFNKLDAYWNIDDGTGRVRGASVFGPPEAAAIVAQYFKPFEEWGIYGAVPTTARVEGGSDNGAFAVAGLPGIGTQQDNIEYNSTTWHTNLDTYERIVPEDVMHNAVITASLMIHLANRDQMLPRFAPDKMPAIPAGRRGGN